MNIIDKIIIKNLIVKTVIGVNDWERCIEQTLIINLTVSTDVKKAANSDQLNDALDYSAIVAGIQSWIKENTGLYLIETLSEKLAAMLLADFPIQWLSLSVAKPGIIEDVEEVAVCIERGQK